MKIIYKYFLIVPVIISFLTILSLNSSDYHKKLMEYAHPTPERDAKVINSNLLSNGTNSSIFLNVNTIEPETEQFQMQNESSIAINPINPKVLIASAVDYRDNSATWVYLSTDGGKSWKNINLGRPYSGWRSTNDPSVAFDNEGIGYLVYGGFGTISDSTGVLFGENGVFISKTTDNGTTWKSHIPIIVHLGLQTPDSTFEDKYYISVDNSPVSPYYRHLYVPWKRVTPRDSATQIVISKSTDFGETWSEPVPVSYRLPNTSEDTTYGQSFPLAITGPNGEVYVVWNHGIEHGVGFCLSTDGGKTFSEPRIIQRYNIFGITRLLEGQGWRHSVKEKVRAETYPSIVCDLTNGPRQGWLYLTWAGDNIPNIYFSRSTDKGLSWSQPKIIHSDTTNDQFWQWISLDPKNGDIAVMYFDSRNDPNNMLVETYVSYSSDGGDTWIDRKVSDVGGDLRNNPFRGNSFAGDYSGNAFYNGMIYPSWIDMRFAAKNIFDSDVFTAPINIKAPEPPKNFQVQIINDEPTKLRLKWEIPQKRAFNQPLNLNEFKYALFRDGKLLTELNSTEVSYDDNNLNPYNFYNYEIFTVAGSDSSIGRKAGAFAGGSKLPSTAKIIDIITQSDKKSVKLMIEIPTLRSDSTTKLVNLAGIKLFRDGSELKSQQLQKADTGKIIEIIDSPNQEGYYNYEVIVFDYDGNTSQKSQSMYGYAGEIYSDYYDNFDFAGAKKYIIDGNWAKTKDFYFSSEYSFTDSPQGRYLNNTTTKFVLYPFSPNKSSILKFKHVAIVHRSDSAYVELSFDKMKTWKILGKYNRNTYPQWQDNNLSKDDWITEIFREPAIDGDTVFLRFRLTSDILGNDDGWYIDDIEFVSILNIDDEISSNNDILIYPNPAKDYLIVDFGAFTERSSGVKLTIHNQLGEKIDFNFNDVETNNNTKIDLRDFNSGIYYLQVYNGYHIIKTKKFIIIK